MTAHQPTFSFHAERHRAESVREAMVDFRHLGNARQHANRAITREPASSRVDITDYSPMLFLNAQQRILPASAVLFPALD